MNKHFLSEVFFSLILHSMYFIFVVTEQSNWFTCVSDFKKVTFFICSFLMYYFIKFMILLSWVNTLRCAVSWRGKCCFNCFVLTLVDLLNNNNVTRLQIVMYVSYKFSVNNVILMINWIYLAQKQLTYFCQFIVLLQNSVPWCFRLLLLDPT